MYPAEVARVGVAFIRDTAHINRMLKQVEHIFPRDMSLAWTAKPELRSPNMLELVALKASLDGKAALEGDAIDDARQDYDQNGRVQLTCRLSSSSNGTRSVWILF